MVNTTFGGNFYTRSYVITKNNFWATLLPREIVSWDSSYNCSACTCMKISNILDKAVLTPHSVDGSLTCMKRPQMFHIGLDKTHV